MAIPSQEENVKEEVQEEEQTQTTETVTEETPATQEEEYDEIIYNKEAVKIPVSERKIYLQKGYNYDKVVSQRDQYKNLIEYVAKLNNYSSVDEFEKALNEEKVKREAAEKGMNPEVYTKLQEMEKELKQTKLERTLNQQREALKNKPFYKENEQEILAIGKTIGDLDAAYAWYVSNNVDKLTAKQLEDAKKQAIEDFKRQSSKGVLSTDDGVVDEKNLDLTQEELAHGKRRVADGTFKDLREFADFLRGKK